MEGQIANDDNDGRSYMDRTPAELAAAVISWLACEHGCSGDLFRDLEPYVVEAWETERHVTEHELGVLCCGAEDGDGVPEELQVRFPRLNLILEEPYSGRQAFAEQWHQLRRPVS